MRPGYVIECRKMTILHGVWIQLAGTRKIVHTMFSTTTACTVALMRAHRHPLPWLHRNRKQRQRARPRSPQSRKRGVHDRRSASRSTPSQKRRRKMRPWSMPKMPHKMRLLWSSAQKRMREKMENLGSQPTPGNASPSHWRTIRSSWQPFSVHETSMRSNCDKTSKMTSSQFWRNAQRHYGKSSCLSSARSRTNRRWSAQRDPAVSQSKRTERRKNARLVKLRRRSSVISRWRMKNRKGYAELKRVTSPAG